MNKNIIFFLIIFLTLSCSGQTNLQNQTKSKQALDSIISIAKTHSIYNGDVNWAKLETEISDRFIDTDSISSIIEPVQYLLTELGDFHGFFTVIDKQYKAFGKEKRNVSYDYTSKKYNDKMLEIYNHSIANTDINGQMIFDSIAYIEIPMILNYQGDEKLNIEYTLKIRKKVCELKKNNPKGYIIDLRRNLGGTVFPMLSGLGELFPNMDLGGGTKNGKDFSSKCYLKEGNLHFGGNYISNMPKTDCETSANNSSIKIAVLIGRYTSSSGELVASSLKSQSNVILIGEQTMGWSTTNSWFPISENVAFNPSISYYMSMDKTTHKDGVLPDLSVKEDFNYKNPTKGKIIYEATKWINETIKK